MVATAPQKTVIVYDGDCHFCRDQIARIQRWDANNQFEYLPRQAPEADVRFPILKSIDFDKGMRLIEPNGNNFEGADAIHQIARRLPATSAIAWLYKVPGINQICKAAYAWVAANRKRLGKTCEGGACHIHNS